MIGYRTGNHARRQVMSCSAPRGQIGGCFECTGTKQKSGAAMNPTDPTASWNESAIVD